MSQAAAFKDRPWLDDQLLVRDIAFHIAAGEQLHLFHVIGFALVLTGVFVASRKPAGAG